MRSFLEHLNDNNIYEWRAVYMHRIWCTYAKTFEKINWLCTVCTMCAQIGSFIDAMLLLSFIQLINRLVWECEFRWSCAWKNRNKKKVKNKKNVCIIRINPENTCILIGMKRRCRENNSNNVPPWLSIHSRKSEILTIAHKVVVFSYFGLSKSMLNIIYLDGGF